MERWQSLHEHRVEYNLSESGVEPFTVRELRELTGVDVDAVGLGYPQTNGTRRLRERIAALYPGAGPENVLVTSGGAEANFLALWGLVRTGDRVAPLLPAYGQTAGLARGLGAEVRPFHLEEDRGWQPAPGAAAEAGGGKARMLVVTHPNNPTGAILSGRAMEEVVEEAERSDAWLLSDEVYAGAEVDGEGTPTFWGRRERTLITGSLSKAYGLPGLRLGWLVGPEATIRELWGRKDYTTIAPAALSDRLAAAALAPDHRGAILERTRGIVRDNLELLRSWLDARPGLFAYRPPDAGAICWVRYGLETGSSELADRLRREKDVLVVPGDHFGMDGYLRIGFGIGTERLRAALVRVADLLGELGAGG
jgi:aspartate/methionine/tyrosine aminotransferase